jgi:outer membrane biosynthesis protein TonB
VPLVSDSAPHGDSARTCAERAIEGDVSDATDVQDATEAMEPGEPAHGAKGFGASILRNLLGALALIALAAGVFWGLGSFGGEDGDLVIADEPEASEPEEEPEPEPEPQPDEPADPEPEPEPDPEPEPEPTEDEPEGDEPEASEPEEEPEPEPDEPDRIDPGTITVQVLDGFQADGGAAAAAVASELRTAGYQVVAENPALRYDVTTVLWTAGAEAQAQQVAAEIGAAEVREQPGNLSSQVQVHVVIGSDRG